MSCQHRILSGMRASGHLHLGHYHGVLKNWLTLQHEYDCFFGIMDLHALTTHYEDTSAISQNSWEMLIDWLAVGVNPRSCCIFIQSMVPEHAELHLLLSMLTPLSWCERVPTYKDQQQKLKEKDLATYGFLGYPVLQAADILLYKANMVPVGEDQVSHVEIAREIARRFNHLYGFDTDFMEKVINAIKKMGKKSSKLYLKCKKAYQEQGDEESLEVGRALLDAQSSLSTVEKERLQGDLEGSGRIILPEPNPLLTEHSKLPGLDGNKMSKSYCNTISLRDDKAAVETKINKMPTDPARVRRIDPGEPEKCPVWGLHKVYSNQEVKEYVQKGCRTAGIGCLDCKKPLIDAILKEQQPICDKAREIAKDKGLLRGIIAEGCEKARYEAQKTLLQVKEAMQINY